MAGFTLQMGNQTKPAVIFELVYLVEASGHRLHLKSKSISRNTAFLMRVIRQIASQTKKPQGQGAMYKWARDITRSADEWQAKRLQLKAIIRFVREEASARVNFNKNNIIF